MLVNEGPYASLLWMTTVWYWSLSPLFAIRKKRGLAHRSEKVKHLKHKVYLRPSWAEKAPQTVANEVSKVDQILVFDGSCGLRNLPSCYEMRFTPCLATSVYTHQVVALACRSKRHQAWWQSTRAMAERGTSHLTQVSDIRFDDIM